MDRASRLRSFWSYLPAFRVVAECEHLPTASRVVGVSAPALSRSIHLLEEQLGRRLFDRGGARLRLNDHGRRFLGAIRFAMRALDEGVDDVIDGMQHPRGELSFTFVPEATPIVAGWIAALSQLGPDLVLRQVARPDDLDTALRRGDLDLALVTASPPGEGLSTLGLGQLRWRLFRNRKADARTARSTPRVVTTPDSPWPVDEPHVVAASVSDPFAAALAVERGARLTAFLPEWLAKNHGLVRCGTVTTVASLQVVHRAPVVEHPKTELALTALKTAAAAVLGRRPRARR